VELQEDAHKEKGSMMPIKVIMKSIYGSHLYGTSTPTSDMDYKQIHMNPLDLILIGKDKGCFNQNTNNSGRNTKDDVDFESKELRTFIHDCLTGVTYAQDLLFTPDHLIMESSDLWKEIISLRHKLVTTSGIIGSWISTCNRRMSRAVSISSRKEC
jgi:predicted nucleotidyltransferase